MVDINYDKVYKNTDKFKEAAIRFQKYGYYTAAPKGTTEARKYWDEEIKRSIEGYHTEDGDFISGYNYFYLNYSPITLVRERTIIGANGKERVVKDRVQEFPDFWDSDKQFFDMVEEAEEQGTHLVTLKARGKGYSFKTASMLCRNYFLIRESKSYGIASEKEFLVKDGLLSKTWDMMDFIDEHTAWTKKRDKTNSLMHRKSSFIENKDGTNIEMGYKSEIIGVTLKNDVQKARGKRGKLILWEEAGKFPGLLEAWQIAQPSVEHTDGKAFGLMIAFGTGGTEQGDFGSLKELFYKPQAYNALEIRNIWDTGASATSCGFFVPQYVNMGDEFTDSDGNSLIVEAKKNAVISRKKVEDNANDKNAIDRYIAERPFTPMEATLQLAGNIFPKKELSEQLARIQVDRKLSNYKQVGDLIFDENGKLNWIQTKEARDILEYPLDRAADKKGAIVIWEHPPTENIPYGLYIGGCLTPGEQVLTDKGLQNVEDVTLDNNLINKEGEEVSINTLLRYDKKNEPVYKVHMNNVDRPTTYTQEHPLYLSETIDGEYNFIKTKDVKEGMWTKYPNFYRKEKDIDLTIWNKYKQLHTPKIDNPLLNEDFWWFVGHWIGDGFNHNQGRNYTIYNSFGNDEIEYLNKYKKIVNTLFNRKPHHKLQNNSNTHKFESKQLYMFLEDNFGKYAHGKYISEWVKYIPEKYKLQLVLGYLDSDGSVFRDRTLIRASFKSINRKLLNDVQDILFSLGIISKFNLSSRAGTYNINGKTGKTKEAYSLQIGKLELKKLAAKYKDDHNSRKLRLAKTIELLQKPRKNNICTISDDNKWIYLKIKNIEESKYTGVVYNFDCETHSFLCQYCTGHNCDPYDHDDSGTGSLGSTFIYKRFQGFESYYDVIAAEYTGRPDTADEYYENVRKLLIYFNATLLYENERKGIFPYFTSKSCDYLLADQPDVIGDIVRKSTVNRKKGVHMVTSIKDWGERELRDWLNEEISPGVKQLTRIMSVPLLQELISYNSEGNFDRVMAMMMVMIYKKELHKVHIKEKTNQSKSDPFLDGPIFAQSRTLKFNLR